MGATSRNKDLFEDYDGFVEKFKPKLTTDDCYTPPAVYDAVLRYVSTISDLTGKKIERPFYPGGDYENYPYTPDSVVVDNPPFSIITKIVRWYANRGIPFFLFAPHLTLGNIAYERKDITKIATNVTVVYENGAVVNTGFVTNMIKGGIAVMTAPELASAIDEAVAQIRGEKNKLPIYSYPANVITTRDLGKVKYADIRIPYASCISVSKLDCQKKYKKTIYGRGWLISDDVVRDYEHAKLGHAKEKFYWELSDREKEIVRTLK